MNRDDLQELLVLAATEGARKAVADMPVPVKRQGTVVAVDGPVVTLHMDGDAPDQLVQADVINKLGVVDDRMYVEFWPNGASYAVGKVGGY